MSHLDTFDYKPQLGEMTGQAMPESSRRGSRSPSFRASRSRGSPSPVPTKLSTKRTLRSKGTPSSSRLRMSPSRWRFVLVGISWPSRTSSTKPICPPHRDSGLVEEAGPILAKWIIAAQLLESARVVGQCELGPQNIPDTGLQPVGPVQLPLSSVTHGLSCARDTSARKLCRPLGMARIRPCSILPRKALARAATALGRSARNPLSRFSTEISHCRTGTGRMTQSTRYAAVCVIRRLLQGGRRRGPYTRRPRQNPARTTHSAPCRIRISDS